MKELNLHIEVHIILIATDDTIALFFIHHGQIERLNHFV